MAKLTRALQYLSAVFNNAVVQFTPECFIIPLAKFAGCRCDVVNGNARLIARAIKQERFTLRRSDLIAMHKQAIKDKRASDALAILKTLRAKRIPQDVRFPMPDSKETIRISAKKFSTMRDTRKTFWFKNNLYVFSASVDLIGESKPANLKTLADKQQRQWQEFEENAALYHETKSLADKQSSKDHSKQANVHKAKAKAIARA